MIKQKKERNKKNIYLIIILALSLLIIPLTISQTTTLPIKYCLTKNQVIEYSKCNPNIEDYVCQATKCEVCVTEPMPGVYCPSYGCDEACIPLGQKLITLHSPSDLHIISEEKEIEFEYEIISALNTKFCDLYINEEKIKTQNPITQKVNTFKHFLNYGTYNWYIACTPLNKPERFSETRTLIINNIPEISLTNPQNNLKSTPKNISFEFNFQNLELEELSDCSLNINQEKYPFQAIQYNNQIEIPLALGEYNWSVECSYNNSILFSSQRKISIKEKIEPDNLIINSPKNNEIYTSRSILLNLTINKTSDVYYKDNNYPRSNWRRICSRCKGSFTRQLTFNEGENNITIKAIDQQENATEINLYFKIDSINPRILRTQPTRGFTQGEFHVQFREETPKKLILYYGLENKTLNIQEDCYIERGNYNCHTNADITSYDSEQIEYWFELIDIANNSDTSRKLSLDVDITSPEIIDLNYEINGRNIYFDIKIKEENIEEVGYSYFDERGRFIQRRLCNRIINQKCQARASFSDGEYNLNIYAIDKAGQKTAQSLNIFIDSRPPRIFRTQPMRGFTNGNFQIEFDEQNPANLTLIYTNNTINKTHQLNLEQDCIKDTRIPSRHKCEIEIDLFKFHNQQIEYYFKLTDRANHTANSRKYSLFVDTMPPIILNPKNFWQQGQGINNRNIYFNISIQEENFDKIEYIDSLDPRQRPVPLCRRLINNKCIVQRSFRGEEHSLKLFITDLAGNTQELFLEFEVN